MIHNRFKNPEAWATYRQDIRDGRIFALIGRSFPAFCRQTLDARGRGVAFKQGPARLRTVLDDLRADFPA